MLDLSRVTVFCFLASYVVALACDWSRLSGRVQISRLFALGFGLAGLIAHTIYLVVRSQSAGVPPLLSSSHDWLLVLAWLAMLSYLFLTFFDRDLAIGVFLLPVVLALVGSAYFVNHKTNHRLDSLYGWKMLHAALLVVGMLGVLVSFVIALMYLVQQKRLKRRKQAMEGFGIPNLEKLARLNRWSIIISVPLLTLGMLTGVGLGLVAKGADSVPFTDPVVIGSTAVWALMFALFVWLALTPRPSGRQIAMLTAWAAGFLLFTLVGLQVLTGQFHGVTSHAWLMPAPGSLITGLALS